MIIDKSEVPVALLALVQVRSITAMVFSRATACFRFVPIRELGPEVARAVLGMPNDDGCDELEAPTLEPSEADETLTTEGGIVKLPSKRKGFVP